MPLGLICHTANKYLIYPIVKSFTWLALASVLSNLVNVSSRFLKAAPSIVEIRFLLNCSSPSVRISNFNNNFNRNM